jgi:hypothetical protein
MSIVRLRTRDYHSDEFVGLLSNYCGPDGFGFPQHLSDEACYRHDANYGVISAAGGNPYWYWNLADQIFVQELAEIDTPYPREWVINWISRLLFELKHHMATEVYGDYDLDSPRPYAVDNIGKFIIEYVVS